MSDADKPVYFLRIDETEVPFVHPDDMTNVEVDWVERFTGEQIDVASADGLARSTIAFAAVAICNADPKRDLDEAAKPLWDLKRGGILFVDRSGDQVEGESGPTGPAADEAPEAKPKAAARRRTSVKSGPAGSRA